jgi:hypothetical protein
MDTKHIHHIHPHSPFTWDHPFHWHPPPEKTYFSLLPFILFLYFLFVVLGGGSLWHLQKFLQYIKYIRLEVTPPPGSFIASPPALHFLKLSAY